MFTVKAEDQPIDIWNVDEEKLEQDSSNETLVSNENNQISEQSIYDLQSNKQIENEEWVNLNSKN